MRHIFNSTCLNAVSVYFSLQSSVRQSSSSGLADLLVIDPSSSQSATTGNNKLLHLKKLGRMKAMGVGLKI